jgi:hypothetical protein
MSASLPPALADPQSATGRPAADEELASRLRVALTRLTHRLVALDPARRPPADALTGLLEHLVADG